MTMLRFIKDHNKKGQKAETIALNYLQEKGLTELQRNFSSKYGEIDLIMQDNEFLVFIEVRYRKQIHFGHPLETINYTKQKKILKTIQYFLMKHPKYSQLPCRIDAIAINSQTKTGQEQIDWIKNAIEA
ncbi:MAG: YraN family protein [Gammaproteobacteria bacterium]|nr:YraN family protein [Gammaproteobacteria bacterium]